MISFGLRWLNRKEITEISELKETFQSDYIRWGLGHEVPRHLQWPHGSYLEASLLVMQMRLSLYHVNTGTLYFYRKDKNVCWFYIQMNDAQDSPYLHREPREAGERESGVSSEFSESPWNSRVFFHRQINSSPPFQRTESWPVWWQNVDISGSPGSRERH